MNVRRRYQMTARATSTEETGDRILDAALACWAQDSYSDVRLEQLAAQAEVTVPTVVRRFGGKAGVIVALVERELRRLTAARRAGADDPTSVVIADLVGFYESYAAMILKMYAEANLVPGLADLAAAARGYHVNWCREVFGSRMDEPDQTVRTRRLAQLVAICDATTWRILTQDGGLSSEQVRLALTELIEPLLS